MKNLAGEARNGQKRVKREVKGSLTFVVAFEKNETNCSVFYVFLFFMRCLFVFHRSVSALDDLGGGSGNECFHLAGRSLKLRSAPCDAELRSGAARRSQRAPASRPAKL